MLAFGDFFRNLSEEAKGLLMMVVGGTLFLYTMGWVQFGLTYLIILGSLFLFFYGMSKTGLDKKIYDLVKRQ